MCVCYVEQFCVYGRQLGCYGSGVWGIIVLCDSLYIVISCAFVMYSNVVFMRGNWVVMGVECGGVIVLCDSLYIGIWCVFVMYSNVVFMEGNWVVMGV